MKRTEIKKMSKDEIVKNIDKFKKDLFNFRFQKMNSQVTNPAKIGETKKTIARLKTFLKGKTNA
ncbi:50S ribosomal protein L29 [Candidatus Pelagibacter sp.]|jgi:large subunit ribosomal protein L29|uniref:50S ribosomal protein L29 n=1 Tax=Candidatus Pelagibacter sp. TaxID=2024849 RepID=UPI0001239D04|nr:LSU ribosomal protein L29P [alpha proteobacterium HIMB5]REK51894.1 MAG: 50S ribosomal protein L29 [Pseudomonadota bacterium]